jgi:predicted NodU family carbamoyl transferase
LCKNSKEGVFRQFDGLGVQPSAALIVDGKVLVFAEEERFNRFKGSFGLMPTNATKF